MILDQQNDSAKFFLNAVNVLLHVTGERPINDDVDLANILEAKIASSLLVETKKEVLAEGWDFNTDENYTFAQDAEGFISIPSNVLDLTDVAGDLVVRDWRLYSKSGQTAKFTSPQSLNIIWDYDFNTLSHALRNYITLKAARKFLARQVMDTSVYGYTKEDEEDALMLARRSDGYTGQFNMLTSVYGVDNMVS